METNKVYHGDYLDISRKYIEDKSIDAVITDPPFGIGFKYTEGEDVANTSEEYGKFIKTVWNEMNRVLKVGGFYAIWQPALYFKHFWDWFGNDIHIYAGCKNFVQLRKSAINYAFDPIVCGYLGKPELKPFKPKRSVDFYVANTAKFVTETNSLARQHPCPRPIDQLEELIKNFVIEDGIVVDFFAGSGTTGVGCLKCNRKYILIEKELKYLELVRERLNECKNTEEWLF